MARALVHSNWYDSGSDVPTWNYAVRVTRLEGKYKFNQNESGADRENVEREVTSSADKGDRQVAAMMKG